MPSPMPLVDPVTTAVFPFSISQMNSVGPPHFPLGKVHDRMVVTIFAALIYVNG